MSYLPAKPKEWLQRAAFRETFLEGLPNLEENRLVRRFGELLFSMSLMHESDSDRNEDHFLFARLRAALADLVYLQRYLEEEGIVDGQILEPKEEKVYRLARRWGKKLAGLNAQLEKQLAQLEAANR